MIAEAIDTFIALGWAFLGWLAVLAFTATVVLLGGTVVGAWAVRSLWRAATGPSWRRGRLRTAFHARTRIRAPHGRTAHHSTLEPQ